MAGTALPEGSDSRPGPREHGILTVIEVAAELRCSKAHVHHLISGKVPGATPLPSLWLGRRRLILRSTFEQWLRNSEQNPGKLV
jgi:excisionase family DNA binding protein